MKLLIERNYDNLEVLTEGENHNKTFRIKGIFAQAEVRNKNERIYPKNLLEEQVTEYSNTKIKNRQSMGELDHSNTPIINLKLVSHLIESLRMDGNNVIGVAKILDTPNGRIAKTLINEGINLGVSTRCLGNVGQGGRVNALKFRTVDIVSDPSAPDATVTALMESKEYIIQGDEIIEKAYDVLKKRLDKSGSKAIKDAFLQFARSLHK
jgi:hypothetical protein